MNWLITIFIALLFFVLSPNVLLRLPKKGSKYLVAGTHALVFAIVWHFSNHFIWKSCEGLENKKAATNPATAATAKKGATNPATAATAATAKNGATKPATAATAKNGATKPATAAKGPVSKQLLDGKSKLDNANAVVKTKRSKLDAAKKNLAAIKAKAPATKAPATKALSTTTKAPSTTASGKKSGFTTMWSTYEGFQEGLDDAQAAVDAAQAELDAATAAATAAETELKTLNAEAASRGEATLSDADLASLQSEGRDSDSVSAEDQASIDALNKQFGISGFSNIQGFTNMYSLLKYSFY